MHKSLMVLSSFLFFVMLSVPAVGGAASFPAPSSGYYEQGSSGNLTYFNAGDNMGNNSFHLVNIPISGSTGGAGGAGGVGGTGGAGGLGGAGGSSTNRNDNTNLNANSNRNDNTNVNANSNRQGQAQGQLQGQLQGQAQSVNNSQGQSVNNSQVISPSQTNEQKTDILIEAAKIPAGLGRQFAPAQETLIPQLAAPNKAEKFPLGYVPAKSLPKELNLAQAARLAEGGSARLERMDVDNGFVTGTSEKGSIAAYASAYLAAMKAFGFCRLELVHFGVTSTPSSFFIGLGSSYTHSALSGSEKDFGMTAGGSGLFGYSKATQTNVFFYTFVISR